MEDQKSESVVKTKINKKVVAIVTVCVVIFIAIITVLTLILNGKPSKYEEKVKDLAKAFYSEDKMKSAIKNETIDLVAAAAWIETIDDSMDGVDVEEHIKDFKKDLKDTKKDDENVEEIEKALIDYAKLRESDETTIKVTNIKKPKQSKKDKKIWTVDATWEYKLFDGDTSKSKMRYVFYDGKIVDIGEIEEIDGKNVMESFFKMTVEYYHL